MRVLLGALVLVFAFGCGHHKKHHHHGKLVGQEKLETGTPVANVKNMVYIMRQPTEADLAELKAKGVEHIINLRTEEEMKALAFDESKWAKDNGLMYSNIPMKGDDAVKDMPLDEIETTFMKTHKQGKKIAVHCSSGNRAAFWLVKHFSMKHGDMNKEKAISAGKKAGMTKEGLIKKAEELF